MIIHYPLGNIDLGDRTVSCKEYAEELYAKYKTGGCLVLPNTKDESGEYLWRAEVDGETWGARPSPSVPAGVSLCMMAVCGLMTAAGVLAGWWLALRY